MSLLIFALLRKMYNFHCLTAVKTKSVCKYIRDAFFLVISRLVQVLVFETTALLKFANFQYFPLANFARFYRVTDEALIAETAE